MIRVRAIGRLVFSQPKPLGLRRNSHRFSPAIHALENIDRLVTLVEHVVLPTRYFSARRAFLFDNRVIVFFRCPDGNHPCRNVAYGTSPVTMVRRDEKHLVGSDGERATRCLELEFAL
jgi:hypothetical protein